MGMMVRNDLEVNTDGRLNVQGVQAPNSSFLSPRKIWEMLLSVLIFVCTGNQSQNTSWLMSECVIPNVVTKVYLIEKSFWIFRGKVLRSKGRRG